MRIGLDVGGTKIEGIILNDDGSLERVLRVPTPADSYPAILTALDGVVSDLQAHGGGALSVGMGIPGALALPARRVKNSNSTCLNGEPLLDDLIKRWGYEPRIENDANCLVLSEAQYGAARGAEAVFGVILGTGTGGGIVIDGKLRTGINQIGGEWGHNSIPAKLRDTIGPDRQCYCGRYNCIETVLQGRGLGQTHAERTGSQREARDIAALAVAGDAAALATLDTYCRQLAMCLATVVNLLDPDVIVIGGGLSNMAMLYERVPGYLSELVFTDDMRTRVLPAQFGDASGARGAACLWPIESDTCGKP